MRRVSVACVWAVSLALAAPAVGQRIEPLRQERATPVVQVFQAARDAVVNISATSIVKTRPGFFGGLEEDPFDDVFLSPFTRDVPVQSLGSGFCIHPDGYIVTNEHVVRRAMKISIILADGTSHAVEVIATDARHDLAILKMALPPGKTLPALPLGRSDDLMIGETVIAIGNPKGYQHSVTSGVISALDRELQFGPDIRYSGLIQTDASINPGNSGGPLLNVNAQVIGINTAIRPDAQGIGFAIAIDDFTKDLPTLLDVTRLHRVVLGMAVEQQDRTGRGAVVVARVEPDGPAAKAGVVAGHVVTGVDGRPVLTLADFYVRMLDKQAGQELRLATRAGDAPREFTILLAERPRPDGQALARGKLGLTLLPIVPDLAQRLRLPTDRGLLVTEIADGSPAQRIGIQVRDVVFQLGQSYTRSLDDVGQALEDVPAGQAFRIGIVRGHVRAWTSIQAAGEAP